MRRSSRSSIFSSLRDSLIVSLSFALAALCLAALSGHAQTATSTASPGWVVIPVEEYQALRAKAYPAEREPEPPPVEATLTRVDYDLRVNSTGDLATGQASLTVDVIKDGWVRVAIPSGLLVREARLDGKEVSLVSGSSGKAGSQLSAVLEHAGRAVLLLEVALPVTSSAGEESLALPSTASGVTRAAVELPRQGVDIRLSGGLLAEKSAGFKSAVYSATPYDESHPHEYSFPLTIGTTAETIEVTAAAPLARDSLWHKDREDDRDNKKKPQQPQQQASANVFNLQKKVAGVLPVRVDVPRAGSSYRFARALVLDEETRLTFSYRTK